VVGGGAEPLQVTPLSVNVFGSGLFTLYVAWNPAEVLAPVASERL
jgi:hypothetical protein